MERLVWFSRVIVDEPGADEAALYLVCFRQSVLKRICQALPSSSDHKHYFPCAVGNYNMYDREITADNLLSLSRSFAGLDSGLGAMSRLPGVFLYN